MKRKNLLQQVLEEKIQYGNIFVGTRHEVWMHAMAAYESKGADHDTAHKCAENFAMRGPELTAEQAAELVPIAKLIEAEAKEATDARR
jgi:hypothetical protein